jgi:hypothetical protein
MREPRLFKTAIYYSGNEWNKLIRDGIQAFVEISSKFIDGHFLFFSSYRGDHVRLIFILKKITDQSFFEQLFFEHFNGFLLLNPSGPPVNEFIPGKSLWMNYANNTVEIGNYETHFLVFSDQYIAFNRQLTELICYLFGNDTITTFEEILDYSIYLICKILRLIEVEKVGSNIEKLVDSIIRSSDLSIQKNLVIETKEEAEKAAIDNYLTIDEYYLEELPGNFPLANETDTKITEFIETCKSILNSDDQLSSNADSLKIVDMLFIQLGIGELSKIYVLTILKSFFDLRKVSSGNECHGSKN